MSCHSRRLYHSRHDRISGFASVRMLTQPGRACRRFTVCSVRQSSSGFHPTRPHGRAVAFRSRLPPVGPAEDLLSLTSYRSIMPSEHTLLAGRKKRAKGRPTVRRGVGSGERRSSRLEDQQKQIEGTIHAQRGSDTWTGRTAQSGTCCGQEEHAMATSATRKPVRRRDGGPGTDAALETTRCAETK